ncbi:hypothetical protein KQ302_03885 [Synechococcus sp. CS-602]|uniref:hypothetical protein n=1 Tax=Synechococcaceae TaxID=1890426 RepID=UPI0008FF64E7|nr:MULTISPECIES: hypothetical protein [Synechococcaceae]MCT4365385.1 hypothetical protein [Candidatus Regnicoccus frigidus MAG-AL1]APD47569.1 hypothetical protein BM449_03830 [Synechococcus sp. SynAce01]MCT0202449.1 hypothetical protein [Synechococcus sp. CS-603]MCT0204255.1 hypothetical protein [Synechococcus sp. CS-602]MCT4368268.1 hypothetical protein [Candidatus Regnicoccus frigidus MAG-AL2]
MLPLLAFAVALPAAHAGPFSFDPVSFAGYANNWQKLQGNDLVFRNLSLCAKEGNGGYSCLAGEVLRKEPGKSGRFFCKLRSVGYHPNTRSITFVTRSCEYRSGQRRIIDQSEKLFQKGLDTLENFTN